MRQLLPFVVLAALLYLGNDEGAEEEKDKDNRSDEAQGVKIHIRILS